MRDLAKDSRWLQRQEPNRDNHISVNFYRAYDWLNQAIRAESEVERLKRALSDIEDWCVEFHETGPHDPDKALKIVMTIYDIANKQLGDRTEEFKVKGE